jgi:hypothetical protein
MVVVDCVSDDDGEERSVVLRETPEVSTR